MQGSAQGKKKSMMRHIALWNKPERSLILNCKSDNRIFVSQIVPQEHIVNLLCVSQAGNNFMDNLREAVRFRTVFVLVPFSIEQSILNLYHDDELTPVQNRIFPHRNLGKYLNVLIENINLCIKILKYDKPKIWFYNLNSHNVLVYVFFRIILRQKCFLVVADQNEPLSGWSLTNLMLVLLKRSSGIIFLAGSLHKKLKHQNSLVLPGILPSFHNNHFDKKKREVNRKQFLFSGAIEEYTGILLALEVFKELDEFELIISGTGNCIEEVKKTALLYKNITYIGFVPYEEYLETINDIDFILSFRNPDIPENLNNFPSKIIESFFYQKIVLTTMEYDQLSRDSYFYSRYDKDSVIGAIKAISLIENQKLIHMMEKNRKIALEKYSSRAWEKAFDIVENGE